MMNTLVENARKYTQEGGKVSLSAEETPDYVEIAVEDNGPGLSERIVCVSWERKCTIQEPSVWILPRMRQSCNVRKVMVSG